MFCFDLFRCPNEKEEMLEMIERKTKSAREEKSMMLNLKQRMKKANLDAQPLMIQQRGSALH